MTYLIISTDHECFCAAAVFSNSISVSVCLSGLSVRTEVPSKMAIFDGTELMFEESDWFIVNFLRMLWRYGFNALRMHMYVEGLLDKFMR